MSKPSYYARNGIQCQRVEWERLRQDRSYCIVRQYDNGGVQVVLEWVGAQFDASNVFEDCRTLFVLHVSNYNDAGNLVCDPVEHGRTFATQRLAIKAYEDFLIRWTESYRVGDEFVEEENDLEPPEPPEPPKPDAPTSSMKNIKLGAEMDGSVW